MRVTAFRSSIGILPLLSSSTSSPPPRCSPNTPLHFFRPHHNRPPASISPSSLLLRAGLSSSFPAAAMTSSMERQFEEFRSQLEDSGAIRDRIRAVVSEMESAIRIMQFGVLLVHQSPPVAQVVEKAGVQIGVLREQFRRLAEILRECPGQYHRYHGDWKSETQSAVSLIAFLHWLESGNLLLHHEAEEKLGLDAEFGLDIEDYLIGLCFMSNDLPRYVVNQVTAGDYDCPNRVLRFLTELHAAFRMLNLRNDFLRKKFDSMKYDLRKVEEVFYDVKIRGLATSNTGLDKEAPPIEPSS